MATETNQVVEAQKQEHLFRYDSMKALPTMLYAEGVPRKTIITLLGRSAGTDNRVDMTIQRFIDKWGGETGGLERQQAAQVAVQNFLAVQERNIAAKKPKVAKLAKRIPADLQHRMMLRGKEVAAYLGVSLATVKRWEAEGIIPPARRIGRVILWDRQELEVAVRGSSEAE